MSGSRRQRDSLAPSLFPFLAVLLCTMGALVLILMLIVAGAQTSAKEIAEESDDRVEEAEAMLEHAKRTFQKQLSEGRIALEKKRLVLQHVEKHIQELLDELDDLKRTAELVELDESNEALDKKERQSAITELEKQLAEATKELKQKLQKPDGDKPIFAIIPYQGNNGTHRRPIYLECTDAGVVVQPEGVVVAPADLRPPYGPGNPLDAALRTVRAEFPPRNGAVTSTAYPLLIVRPSGVRNYALARAAMSGWDDQFGYELISEDLELAFPESSPGLDAKLIKALALARDRQAALVMAMPNKYRQRGSTGYPDADGSSDDWGDGSRGGDSGDLWKGSPSARGGYSLAGDADPSLAGQSSSNQGAGSPQGFGEGSGVGPDGRTQSANADANWNSSAANDANAFSPDSQLAMNGLRPNGQSEGGSGSAELDSLGANTGSTSQQADGQSTAGNPGTGKAGGAQASAGGKQFELPFAAGGSSPAGGQSPSSATANSAQPTSAATNSANSASASDQAGMSPQVSLNRDLTQSAKESAQPVAKSRGRDWAWSQGPPTQTPVVRSIRVECLSDRWLVLPDRGSTVSPTTISFDASPRERAEQLARVVHARVESWGIALDNGYWKPVLAVDVAPDAKWRYDQLQQLLDGSGLEIQRQADRGNTLRR